MLELCKGVHCVDLGESFPTTIYYLLAKCGFDTAENEPCEVCPLSVYRLLLLLLLQIITTTTNNIIIIIIIIRPLFLNLLFNRFIIIIIIIINIIITDPPGLWGWEGRLRRGAYGRQFWD